MNGNDEELAFLQAGVAAHNSGDLENAEVSYRKALAINPHNPDALHLLGFLAHQLGFPEEALSLINDAIQLSPSNVLYFNNLATVYKATGEIGKAIIAYRQSVRLKGDDPDVLNNLGNFLRELAISDGDNEGMKKAKKFIQKAIKIRPNFAKYHNNLGNILRDMMPPELDGARKSYKRALKLDPSLVGAIGNLGLLGQIDGEIELAEGLFLEAVERAPNDFEALNNYAQFLGSVKRFDEALPYYDKAELLAPENYTVGYNKARALMSLRRDDEALSTLHHLMELDPKKIEAYRSFAIVLRKTFKLKENEDFINGALEHFPDDIYLEHQLAAIYLDRADYAKTEKILRKLIDRIGEGNIGFGGGGLYATLGIVYLETGTKEQVEKMFKLAMDVEPDNATARNNYALSLIGLGNLEEGWKVYSKRWDSESFTSPIRPFQKPVWQGEPLQEKTIALWGEQGIGDEIRFASMIPDMMDKGADIIIECDLRLVPLFERSFDGAKVFGREDDFSVPYEETCDFQMPIADLTTVFRPTVESFPPGPYAYLKPDPDKAAFWRDRLADLGPAPKVGILWRSMMFTEETMPHYAKIEELEPIWRIPGIDYINLMYAECSEERAGIADLYGVNLHTWDDMDLKDDQDSLAALMSNLDLVIQPSTATGYLAAALAIPVFNFITMRRTAELLGDPDAPGWAPSMRHFIKGVAEPWGPTMSDIASQVKQQFGLT